MTYLVWIWQPKNSIGTKPIWCQDEEEMLDTVHTKLDEVVANTVRDKEFWQLQIVPVIPESYFKVIEEEET